MTPYIMAALFVAGIVAGGLPVRMYYEAKEDQRAKVEAEAALEQEKRNVAIVTQYQDLLSGVSDWYRRNPVRVRIQGRETSPGCPTPDASSILLNVGGYEGSDGGAIDP